MPQVKERKKAVRIVGPHRPGAFTYEDYRERVADGQKADLIDGVIYMASPDNTDAGEFFVWLMRVIHDFMDHHDLGKIYGSRVTLRLDDKNGPEPDLAVVLKENSGRVERRHILGPCDLAVEIVSPESVERDYVKKRELYERFGVPEYWIMDDEMGRITLLRLGPKGYTEARARRGVFTSKVLPGFWFRTEWLRQDRPTKAQVLAEILAGPPK